MNRKILMSMLCLAVAVVAIPTHAAAASSVPYAVPPHQTLSFVVVGNDAWLVELTGEAEIDAKIPLAGGLLRVDVRCVSDVPCTGLIMAN